MRRLAEALIEALEENGPVLMYTDYERRVIAGLAAMYPDLGDALKAVDRRLVDLHPVTKANYYHPDMLGSWSIKAVLPTIAPDLDYAALEGIREGTEASSAYLEAIDTATPAARRNELRRQLLDYCRHDTDAMVRLLEFFAAGWSRRLMARRHPVQLIRRKPGPRAGSAFGFLRLLLLNLLPRLGQLALLFQRLAMGCMVGFKTVLQTTWRF